MAHFNLDKIRKNFPALNQKINGQVPLFLDGPGGTQVPQSVSDAMADYLLHFNSNLLNSPFFAVQKTHEVLAAARQKSATFVNAPRPEDIIFGASMSTTTAHLSRSIAREWKAGDEIIVSALDHFSNVSFWQMAAEDKGVTCHVARVDTETCTLDIDHLESLLSDKTKLVAFTLASNVSGSRVDAPRIIKAAQAVGALTYVDSVHAAPHFLPDVQALDCDFLACSAYKFSGPHLGFIYGKQSHFESLTPYKVEPAPTASPECWETGTKNFEALAGFSAIIDYMASYHLDLPLRAALEGFYADLAIHERTLSNAFLERASHISGFKIYGITDPTKLDQRSSTFAFTLEGHSPQTVSDHLAHANISTGAGNFYAKGLVEALGLTDKGGITRAGFVHYNTMDELNRFFEVLEEL
ncbi:MAG: cysteine desulfurase-like protein [Rickettsiales bacterium]|nr:cysteine desulfurase-like protein [Rickettsiales bacterium]